MGYTRGMGQPAHLRAHLTLKWALRARLVRRWSCFDCGSAQSEPIIDDPDQPLKARWLCRRCRRKEKKEHLVALEQQLKQEEQQRKQSSWAECFRSTISQIELNPQLYMQLSEQVRSLDPRFAKLDKTSPLFRQLLVQKFLHKV
jgi:hypothetical protein